MRYVVLAETAPNALELVGTVEAADENDAFREAARQHLSSDTFYAVDVEFMCKARVSRRTEVDLEPLDPPVPSQALQLRTA